MSVAITGPVSAESEVRFMYLTEETGGDIGWRNWRSDNNEDFITELEKVLQNGYDEDSYDDKSKQLIAYCKQSFAADILRIKSLFGNGITVVTEGNEALRILLKDYCYTYVGIMRNQLHMSFFIGRKLGDVSPYLCCCFLFKSRSQKLSELTFEVDTIPFDLDGSIFR
jgi:hypothetical protein